jgi:hypothetical protein
MKQVATTSELIINYQGTTILPQPCQAGETGTVMRANPELSIHIKVGAGTALITVYGRCSSPTPISMLLYGKGEQKQEK